MSFRFFESSLADESKSDPKTMYESLQQEYVNLQWDNTSALALVKEQSDIGSDIYRDIEVWIDTTVDDVTSGLKNSNDFLKLIFKDIKHRVKRGLMYLYDNNYWIINNYSPVSGLVQHCGIRRCNNVLRIVDPINGAIHNIPCCVDYDMASPSQQTNRYVITPNNHAVVIVQGNDLTLRLLKTNTRYMLSGRPFKLLAYQNAVEYSTELQHSTLLYLDLYLDELHDKDDIAIGLADNGQYDYTIAINSQDMKIPNGFSDYLEAKVLLNGVEVIREICWCSSNSRIATVNDGYLQVLGEEGEKATITAYLEGNKKVFSQITVTVSNTIEVEPVIIVEPLIEKIRQFQKYNFSVKVKYAGGIYYPSEGIQIRLSEEDKDYAVLSINEDETYTLTALKPKSTPVYLMIEIIENSVLGEKAIIGLMQLGKSLIDISKTISLQIVSMLG